MSYWVAVVRFRPTRTLLLSTTYAMCGRHTKPIPLSWRMSFLINYIGHYRRVLGVHNDGMFFNAIDAAVPTTPVNPSRPLTDSLSVSTMTVPSFMLMRTRDTRSVVVTSNVNPFTCLLLVWLFQQATRGSVGACRVQHFRRTCANSSHSSPPKRRAVHT